MRLYQLFVLILLLMVPTAADNLSRPLNGSQFITSLHTDEQYNRQYVGNWFGLLGGTLILNGLLNQDHDHRTESINLGSVLVASSVYFHFLFRTPAERAYMTYQKKGASELTPLLKDLRTEQSHQRTQAGWVLSIIGLGVLIDNSDDNAFVGGLLLGAGLAHLCQETATERRLNDFLSTPSQAGLFLSSTRSGLQLGISAHFF